MFVYVRPLFMSRNAYKCKWLCRHLHFSKMTFIISPIQYALIQYTLVPTPLRNGLKFPSLLIWLGLKMPLWTNAVCGWKWHSMTFAAGSEMVTQLLSNSSGMLALGAARGYVRKNPVYAEITCWRHHLRHSRCQEAELSGHSSTKCHHESELLLGCLA